MFAERNRLTNFMNIPYHNPKNVPSAGEGWRFKIKGELINFYDEYWNPVDGEWVRTERVGDLINQNPFTYRTRALLPEPWIYQDEAYRRGVEEHANKGGWISCCSHNFMDWTAPYKKRKLNEVLVWSFFYYKIAEDPKEEVMSLGDIVSKARGHQGPPEHTIQFDKPKVILDWSKLPKEAMWVAMEKDGILLAWYEKPQTIYDIGWGVLNATRMLSFGVNIPFAFSGDWKDSLTPRPEELEECSCCGGYGTHISGCPEAVTRGEGDSPDDSTDKSLVAAVKSWEHPDATIARLQSERDRLRSALNYMVITMGHDKLHEDAERIAIKILEEIEP